METEIINRSSGRKTFFIILIIIIAAFLIYYSVMSMLSPVRKLADIKSEFSAGPAGNISVDERMSTDSLYLALLKEKAFLQSRIAMAESDSIYLTVDLSDSTANIEISGVVVHKAKISHLRTSKILIKGNDNIILSMLASPFTIMNSFATIKKDPVMVKVAPKDTSEYKPSVMPDTSLTEPVNYILELTSGVRIYVYQLEKENPRDRMNLIIFNLNDRFRDIWSSLKRVALFKVPEYHPFIKMKLSRADAKIIYRALPKNGQIAVFR
jgi:hypothetical protein